MPGPDVKPAPHPCASCPYRRDVPSGVWAASEYEKLPPYDRSTGEQPIGAFYCHQENGRLCSGWVGCHDMEESMAVRISVLQGKLTEEDVTAVMDYECPVPLFGSGAEAAAHGLREVERPSSEAARVGGKVAARRKRRGGAA